VWGDPIGGVARRVPGTRARLHQRPIANREEVVNGTRSL
jgi:hypothetical protein